MKNDELKLAFSLTTPTMVAYFSLAFVFGVLFTHADFDWYLAPLMSALVYAGAVQFVALSMMNEHASILGILLATLFVALRNSFYGLSLIERFKPASFLKKFFLIFGLVDATYAIFSIKPKQNKDISFCFYVTLFPYLSWVSGTFFGALFADKIPEVKGMSFILTSFFMLLVIEYYLLNKKIDALIIPVIAAFIAYWLMPQYYLLLAILSCAFYLYIKIRVTS
ncbi:branched-chain amino acid ABC transporter permease [Legionella israelensis]|uniref:Branched-chain amino acid ABC transporter permease n=1 Tax=Legionella israelensis TaxID=454 RepID=A0AAX1ED51_9GAMM|nr:AzlC family ABC transporter permease [Legionella israelensis]QBR82954.1 branched-chain amino acid ABC transporter permease [Legionella israelensis]QDP71529.1 AzlC family ABC transporter permease [Legionella israelensis]